MKKLFIAFTIALIITVIGFVGSGSSFCRIFYAGDANYDNKIDVGDCIAIERMIAGLDPVTITADANKDGVVNSEDIVKVQKVILRMEKPLKVLIFWDAAPPHKANSSNVFHP